jgi:CO/xanthine dehydrogenase FAD-binding subunit
MLVSAYHRPATLDEALAHLREPGAVALAGGTHLIATGGPPHAVVDLQALGIACIRMHEPDALVLGAMATLDAIAHNDLVPGSLRDAARREHPSTLRAAATIGGCIGAADPASELLAALLTHDAEVRIVAADRELVVGLPTVLDDPGVLAGRIISSVTIDPRGVTATARTGRTRADRAIVSAAARRTPSGRVRLALSGVAATPVLVDDLEDLEPRGDFRGSAEYRRALATVLAARAVAGLGLRP